MIIVSIFTLLLKRKSSVPMDSLNRKGFSAILLHTVHPSSISCRLSLVAGSSHSPLVVASADRIVCSHTGTQICGVFTAIRFPGIIRSSYHPFFHQLKYNKSSNNSFSAELNPVVRDIYVRPVRIHVPNAQ